MADVVKAGRTPVVLTKYVDHASRLAERLKPYADRLILLTGSNGTKARKAKVDELYAVDDSDSLILVGTGSLLGEGFDYPRLNTQKVNRIISELGKRQELGVKVTIVTWHPDAYKYGRDDVRMELMEKLRKAGFEVKLVEGSCEHFAVIDQEIVWYGSMNLLSKEDAEDNLMRVCSKEIAVELLEMTFDSEVEMQKW